MKRRTHQVGADEAGPLLPLLARVLTVRADEARALVARGAVYVQGRRCRDEHAGVHAGQTLLVVLEEAGQSVLAPPPPAPPLRLLHEDAAVLAVDKPAGLTAQPTPGRAGDSLLDLVRAHLGREPGLVHRLDRETSGVTVFGKTSSATTALAAQFRDGRARKRYLAICGPALAERGRVDLPLSRDPTRPGRFRATRAANGVPAMTDWVRLHSAPDHALVALFPLTGRTHQLRAHLTALGAPICGDTRYGGEREVAGAPAGRCLLHAQALRLVHPDTGTPLLLEAPLPQDMQRVFDADGVTAPRGDF
ncbi:MAG: RluA family pseudouridine synthase [Myxococcaceae bacterium]|nr:RluA family pseudouridine synthase [Myxococcaceae bacterium]MCI0671506.1 RluA family pseudouridine synthase [Myxococcaceae bacterium]